MEEDGASAKASPAKEVATSKISALSSYGAVGKIQGACTAFQITGLPKNALITNVQAWTPKGTKITQGTFTALEGIQVRYNGAPSGYFKYWVTDGPSDLRPCNTTAFNGNNPNAKYQVEIQANVLKNESGLDGFTVGSTKLRVTYTY